MLQEDHVFAILLGKSNSGKTHMLRYLLNEEKPKQIVIFSETMRASGDLKQYKKYIHPNYDPNVLERLFKRQTSIKEAGHNPPATYVIMDDCCSHREYNDTQLRRLAVSGRHYNIKTILTSQYPYLIPPVLRANATHLFVFNLGDDLRSNQTLYEWIGAYYDHDEFKKWAFKYLKSYVCLYVRPGNEGPMRLIRAPKKIKKIDDSPESS